jgi:perosamine synthetase
MSDRYISLYFASIDTRRAVNLLGAWAVAPVNSSDARRAALSLAVTQQIGPAKVFAYRSARGALAACFEALGIGPGDAVLLSSFTCLAVPTAVLAVGARPEYVDIDPQTLNTDPDVVIDAMRPGVKAVVVQHTLGRSVDVTKIVAVGRERGIAVIEDCALSVGSTHNGRAVGAQADAAVFSMELSKTISCGWGGILAVRDAALAGKVAARYAMLPEPPLLDTGRRVMQAAVSGICYAKPIFPIGRYIVAAGVKFGLFKPSTPASEYDGRPAPDFVSRLSGTQAVLAATQWRRLPQIAATSAAVARRLRDVLKAEGLTVLAEASQGDLQVSPRIAFLVRDRRAAMRWFASNAVELGAWFDGPLSPLPDPIVFNYEAERYPRAVAVARHIVNLACHCGLTDADVDRLVAAVRRYAAAHPADRTVTVASL